MIIAPSAFLQVILPTYNAHFPFDPVAQELFPFPERFPKPYFSLLNNFFLLPEPLVGQALGPYLLPLYVLIVQHKYHAR